MILLQQVKLSVHKSEADLKDKVAKELHISPADILNLCILKLSIDARRKPEIYRIYSVCLEVRNESAVLKKASGRKELAGRISEYTPQEYHFPKPGEESLHNRPVIVGAGPAGYFCAYALAKAGYRPIVLERGKAVEERCRDVDAFWQSGLLNPESNVSFGEGGAGTFSDGKLQTMVKDKDGRGREVLRIFVECGANSSILYDYKPHIGTDELRTVVARMREEIIRFGGEVRFGCLVTDVLDDGDRVCGVKLANGEEILCEQVVLAIGHSARDTFRMLYNRGFRMEAKSFAVGLRVQHPQKMINLNQYGSEADLGLGASPYKVTAHYNDRNIFSFCMCPGGYVVNASSEADGLVVNGMSYSGRDGRNANSAIIVSVTPDDYPGDSPLAGIEFQRELEKKAYAAGGGLIPAQRLGIYRECVRRSITQAELERESERNVDSSTGLLEPFTPQVSDLHPETKGETVYSDLSGLLGTELSEAFVAGMENFNRYIPGFNRDDCILCGVESRTSSPVRICRDENLQSSVRGIYPCGEGAGYAGGITSAAMDGLRVAEEIAAAYRPFEYIDTNV